MVFAPSAILICGFAGSFLRARRAALRPRNRSGLIEPVSDPILGEAEVNQRDESGPPEKTPGAIMADASANNKDELTDESAKSDGLENS
jgi:hypothetical protein